MPILTTLFSLSFFNPFPAPRLTAPRPGARPPAAGAHRRSQHRGQPLGDSGEDRRAMTFQRMRLPRDDDHAVPVLGTGNPERGTLPVPHHHSPSALPPPVHFP